MTLKVLNLNISCSTPWLSKKDKLSEIVTRMDPDILCLQEVAQNFAADTPRFNQNERIQELLEAKFAHSIITHPYIPDGERASENCLHGPGIFVTNKNIAIEQSEDIKIYQGEDRAYYNTAAKLTYNGKSFFLVNIHFSAENRHEEAQATLDWISSSNPNNTLPVIICGDLNPHDVSSNTDVDAVIRKVYKDAWRELRPNEEAVTYYDTQWWAQNFPNAPQAIKKIAKGGGYPSSALDYIFYSGVQPNAIEKFDDCIPVLSDHAGLLFEFTF
jgi:endonuclease/exonuclease/phosphatase family metal-dependent hydrolase